MSVKGGWGLADLGWVSLGQSASSQESNETWLLTEVWAQKCSMHVHSETLGKGTSCLREALLVVGWRHKTARGNSKASRVQVQNWHTITPVSIHWLKQVTWPKLWEGNMFYILGGKL